MSCSCPSDGAKVRFGQTRRHLGPIFHALARQKEYGSFVTVRRLWLKDELDFLLKYWRRLHHSRICVGLNVTYEQARYAAVRRQLFLLLDDNYFSLSTTITL